MSTRSAEASIRGYNYQFLHTVKDIIELASDDNLCTVEGVEDFDIEKDTEKDLIQYKYHENKDFQNSRIAKPIALMFKYFLENRDKEINYRLFIYLIDDEFPDKDDTRITNILKIKEARKILSNSETELTLEEIDNMSEDISSFNEKLFWKKTQKYSELEENIINIFETNLGISNSESKIIYLANAVKIISDLSMKDGERNITKRDFLNRLKSYEKVIHSSFLNRVKGFSKLKSYYKKQKNSLNIKKDTVSYVVQINNINRDNIAQFVIELSKKFCYKDNKSTYKPITFVINCPIERYKEFKKNIFNYILSENELIKINDGYEDYKFNINIFNEKLFSTKKGNGNKYNSVSFNFKFIHQSIFKAKFENMNYSSIGLFIIDNSCTDLLEVSEKLFYLNNLTNEQMLEIIGE